MKTKLPTRRQRSKYFLSGGKHQLPPPKGGHPVPAGQEKVWDVRTGGYVLRPVKEEQNSYTPNRYELISHRNPLVVVRDKHGIHTHASLDVANHIHGTRVKHTDVHAGPVGVTNQDNNKMTFELSKHHERIAVKEEAEQVEEGLAGKIKKVMSDMVSPGRRQEWADSRRKRGLHTAIKQTRDGRVMAKNQKGQARSFGQSEKDLARRYAETGHKPFWWKMKEEFEQIDEVSRRSGKLGVSALKKAATGVSALKKAATVGNPTNASDTNQKRIERNQKGRARHWSKTGVSSSTIKWMKDSGFLESYGKPIPGHKLLPGQERIRKELLKQELAALKKQRNDNRQAGTPALSENDRREANDRAREARVATPRPNVPRTLETMRHRLQVIQKQVVDSNA